MKKHLLQPMGFLISMGILGISSPAQAQVGEAEEQQATRDGDGLNIDHPEVSILQRKTEFILRIYNNLPEAQRDPELPQQLQEATRYREQGDLMQADYILNQALQVVGKAARSRGGKNRVLERSRIQYEDKLNQYESLREAMHAILSEKGMTFESVGNQALIQRKFDAATKYADDGRYLLANQQIDLAYRQLSLAVTKLRDKETLEYKLEFADPSEEYAYERRRYHTHELLLKMQLAEKADPTQLTMAIDRMTLAAEEHHKLAEDEAQRREYEKAIKTQEKAISLLIDALRQAGLYLPQ